MGATKDFHEPRHLLCSQEIPPVMRCRFILRGYRKLNQPWGFYLRSLLSVHNETLNVWTHLVGAILIVLEARYLVNEFGERFPRESDFVIFYATCSTLMHLASTSTHLLHSRSCSVHMFVFFCDYAGISIAALGVSLTVFCFCSLPEYAALLRSVFLPLSAINAFTMFFVFSYVFATRRRQYTTASRLLMLLPTGTYYAWTFANFIYKLYIRTTMNRADIDLQFHHIKYLLLLIGGFLFYITRFPERFYPGQFDICGQSHQLFHCGVSLSQWSLLKAIHKDVIQDSPMLYSRQRQPIPISYMWITWIILVALDAVFLYFFYKSYCRDEANHVKD